MKESAIKISDTEIEYIEFGEGTEPLVVIPGISLWTIKGTGAGIAHMYRLFGEKFRVYCIDKRLKLPERVSIDELAEDYAFAFRELGIKNACVYGVSQGGMIAQSLAIVHPELVKKMVLAVTDTKCNNVITSTAAEWVRLVEAGDYKALFTDFLHRMYSDEYVEKYAAIFPRIPSLRKPSDPGRFITLARACTTINTYDRLGEIKCPVFAIGAENDRVVTPEGTRKIAQKLGCEFYIYEKYGHAVYEEAKDFNSRVLSFLLE